VEWGSLPGQAVDGFCNGVGGQLEALVAGETFPRAGMQDQVLCAQGEGALDLAAKATMLLERISSDWLQMLIR
jgi:hypothetical protein